MPCFSLFLKFNYKKSTKISIKIRQIVNCAENAGAGIAGLWQDLTLTDHVVLQDLTTHFSAPGAPKNRTF